MHPFPHRYRVDASAEPVGTVRVTSAGLPELATAPPAEFDGPGDSWSPETLLVGAVADCFVLSFRSVAAPSRVVWHSLAVEVQGVLDRVDKVTQFTELHIRARVVVPADIPIDRAERALHKAEQVCLISNSLKATVHLVCEVELAG